MAQEDKVNVLLVDDQPAKLLAYETILQILAKISSKHRPQERRCSIS